MVRRNNTVRRLAAAALLVAAVSPMGNVAALAAEHAEHPTLATPGQLEAERALLGLVDDPDVQAVQAEVKAELAATPTGQSADGAATLDRAIAWYTNALIMTEASAYQSSPAFILFDDTPRSWFGMEIGGTGIAGDNPDNVYRRTTVDGSGQYEITGRIDLAHRPSQTTIEVMRGNVGPMQLKEQTKGHADMGNHVSITFDRNWTVGDDGSFRLVFGGAGEGPDYLASEPGQVTVLLREALSDWNQRPAIMSIRRIDGGTPPAAPLDLKQRVLANLADYIRFWGSYHTTWLGGLEPNAFNPVVPRDGGWGFLAGVRYKLGPDEALLVRTTDGGAKYTGFQVTDPWMIAPASTHYLASLNLGQATPDADGGYTYLISPTDPGIANWLDTVGLQEGIGIMRWQEMPDGATGAELLKEVRVIKLADVPKLKGVARVTPEERKAQIEANGSAYAARVQN